jgi:hypothetical protein
VDSDGMFSSAIEVLRFLESIGLLLSLAIDTIWVGIRREIFA